MEKLYNILWRLFYKKNCKQLVKKANEAQLKVRKMRNWAYGFPYLEVGTWSPPSVKSKFIQDNDILERGGNGVFYVYVI